MIENGCWWLKEVLNNALKNIIHELNILLLMLWSISLCQFNLVNQSYSLQCINIILDKFVWLAYVCNESVFL